MTDTPLSSPGVHYPPPILFVLGLGLGWLVGRAAPIPLLPDGLRSVSLAGGWLLVGLGLATIGWAMLTFRRARTAIYPNQPATSIVEQGPFRHSRNPMYLGLSTLHLGVALVSNSLWMAAALPAVLWLLTVLVIQREERYLTSAFGETYTEYCRRVRRWI